MAKKERILNELKNVKMSNNFLELVFDKWFEELQDNDDYILGEISDGTKYGANTGGVNFVIYCADNEKFVKGNIEEVHEFLIHCHREFGVDLDWTNPDEIMWAAVEFCASEIDNQMSLNESDYEEEEEEEEQGKLIMGLFRRA